MTGPRITGDPDDVTAMARFVLALRPVGDRCRTLPRLAPQDLGPQRVDEVLAPARDTATTIAPAQALRDKALAEPVPVRNIPEGLGLRSVTTAETGVSARFTGRAVTFRPDTSSA
ncbi:hypothetical protein [Streptomyces sp. NPDC050263]|uniref:hypothetical protein n=1 Tax=Streptomyces sp. NPDC050263 TaxID=3155037 RepID=UPI003428EE32